MFLHEAIWYSRVETLRVYLSGAEHGDVTHSKACAAYGEGRETAERFRPCCGVTFCYCSIKLCSVFALLHIFLWPRQKAFSHSKAPGLALLIAYAACCCESRLNRAQVVLDGGRGACGAPNAVTVIWLLRGAEVPCASHVLTLAMVIAVSGGPEGSESCCLGIH